MTSHTPEWLDGLKGNITEDAEDNGGRGDFFKPFSAASPLLRVLSGLNDRATALTHDTTYYRPEVPVI
jgi:hypothetical protein